MCRRTCGSGFMRLVIRRRLRFMPRLHHRTPTKRLTRQNIALPPVFFLLRNRPEDMGLLPDGLKPGEAERLQAEAAALQQNACDTVACAASD